MSWPARLQACSIMKRQIRCFFVVEFINDLIFCLAMSCQYYIFK